MTPNSLQSPWRNFDDESGIESTRKPSDAKFRSGDVIQWTVPHPPRGAPRMTQRDKWQQRPCVMAYRAFKDAIREYAPEIPQADQIASLSWVAQFLPPKSQRKRIGQLHRQKPDRDNIDKAVLDALFEQDQAIACGTIEKRWGNESKITITIIVA